MEYFVRFFSPVSSDFSVIIISILGNKSQLNINMFITVHSLTFHFKIIIEAQKVGIKRFHVSLTQFSPRFTFYVTKG